MAWGVKGVSPGRGRDSPGGGGSAPPITELSHCSIPYKQRSGCGLE